MTDEGPAPAVFIPASAGLHSRVSESSLQAKPVLHYCRKAAVLHARRALLSPLTLNTIFSIIIL